jgi:hypothetical protein
VALEDLGERDLRRPVLCLHVLHAALRLLDRTKPTIFFSHAKRDGVPLTTAARGWVNQFLRDFDTYYDTVDLNLDGDIEAQLSSAVSKAIVIVFRSDSFDQRYWCQKEVLWAEANGRPVITVDARWQVEYEPSFINFDSTPVIRIPDGSVTRILLAAFTEATRVALFQARVSMHKSSTRVNVAVVPRCPSLMSLEAASTALKGSAPSPSYIVYPNPALPTVMYRAAQALLQGVNPACHIVSFDEFITS